MGKQFFSGHRTERDVNVREIIRRAIQIGKRDGRITFDELNELCESATPDSEEIELILNTLSEADIRIEESSNPKWLKLPWVVAFRYFPTFSNQVKAAPQRRFGGKFLLSTWRGNPFNASQPVWIWGAVPIWAKRG